MKKLVSIAICLFALMSLADQFMFSSDGVKRGSGLRECPSQAVDLKTGEVVVGLHSLTDSQRASCGWYRFVPVPKPDTNHYYRVKSYVFAPGGTVSQVWEQYTPKPRKLKYSKLSIIKKLESMNGTNGFSTKWEEVKASITATGYIDKWNACTYIAADDPDFLAIKPALASILQMTIKQLDDVLSSCQY